MLEVALDTVVGQYRVLKYVINICSQITIAFINMTHEASPLSLGFYTDTTSTVLKQPKKLS